MKILITAGATAIPIDRVRVISNIFRGTTGTRIAECMARYYHDVTLLISDRPQWSDKDGPIGKLAVKRYRTFDDLAARMEQEIVYGGYDVVIHSAAVGDYRVASVQSVEGNVETSAKIKSSHAQLQITLVPTEKLIDKIRSPWGFKGTLVKFKLEVDTPDVALIEIARRSKAASQADLIVANCLEWSRDYAYIIGRSDSCARVSRYDLPRELLRRLV